MVLTRRLALLIAVGIPLTLLTPWAGAAVTWLGLCALAWGLDTVLAPSPRHLQVSRQLPVSARARTTINYTLKVTNPAKRRYRIWLRDAWPPSLQGQPKFHSLILKPAESTILDAGFTPTRRGKLAADTLTIRSFGPLGLGARQFSAPLPQRLLVLPEFRSAKYLPSRLKTLRRLEGNTLLTQRGQGSEFDSLREYTPGDDIRDIEWRVSARSRTPVVKTWRPERDRNVIICVDTSRIAATRLQDYPRLDALLEASMLLGALASSAGDRVHLLTFDNQLRTHVQPERGAGFISQMAASLATVQPSLTEANWSALSEEILGTVRQRSLLVFLTGVEAGTSRGALPTTIETLSGYHHVLVASPTDPEILRLTQDLGSAQRSLVAAAAMTDLHERQVAADLLTLMGAQVIQEEPEKFPVKLADTYLALKRQGRL